MRNMLDVGSPSLSNVPIAPVTDTGLQQLQESHRSMDKLRSHIVDSHKAKLQKLGHPLRIFGEGSFFQPYIPLQQIDVLEASTTKSFLTGTSNSIFIHHRGCSIDAVAYSDNGNFEILNPAINPLINLTSADKKFIEDIMKPIVNSWTPDNDMSQNQQIDFEGSDDDVRARFEQYTTQLFASVAYDFSNPILEPGQKKVDYLSEYNIVWVNAWKKSDSFKIWMLTHDPEYIGMIVPGHPCHGHTMFNAMAASFSAFGKQVTPTTKALKDSVTSSVNEAVNTITDPAKQEEVATSATQLFSNVSSWYSQKKMQWMGNQSTEGIEEPPSGHESETQGKSSVASKEVPTDIKESKESLEDYEQINL